MTALICTDLPDLDAWTIARALAKRGALDVVTRIGQQLCPSLDPVTSMALLLCKVPGATIRSDLVATAARSADLHIDQMIAVATTDAYRRLWRYYGVPYDVVPSEIVGIYDMAAGLDEGVDVDRPAGCHWRFLVRKYAILYVNLLEGARQQRARELVADLPAGLGLLFSF